MDDPFYFVSRRIGSFSAGVCSSIKSGSGRVIKRFRNVGLPLVQQ
jgi:hypothetical protein